VDGELQQRGNGFQNVSHHLFYFACPTHLAEEVDDGRRTGGQRPPEDEWRKDDGSKFVEEDVNLQLVH
jgi:hypothetical protein